MQSLSTSAILSVFWAHFDGKFQVFWYIHFTKISWNMTIFHYGRLNFQSSYHFTIKKELKLFKMNKILWKSLVNIYFVDQMVLFKKNLSLDSYFLTWRIGYFLYVHCPIPHLVGRSFIFKNIIKYSARSHPRASKNFPDPMFVCFWPCFVSRLSLYLLNKRKCS